MYEKRTAPSSMAGSAVAIEGALIGHSPALNLIRGQASTRFDYEKVPECHWPGASPSRRQMYPTCWVVNRLPKALAGPRDSDDPRSLRSCSVAPFRESR